jgi:GNAT superfamily N-acetyltransferase
VPYVESALSSVTGGFVLVDPQPHGAETVVGYVLFTSDTRKFEALTEERWWPRLRETYPYPPPDAPSDKMKAADTEKDVHFFKLFHNTETMWKAPASAVAYSPAHLHIDLLPAAQRQGWGRKLIGRVVAHFRERNAGMTQEERVHGVWIGMDARNEEARKFYMKIGFKPIPGAPDTYLGLDFDDWVS